VSQFLLGLAGGCQRVGQESRPGRITGPPSGCRWAEIAPMNQAHPGETRLVRARSDRPTRTALAPDSYATREKGRCRGRPQWWLWSHHLNSLRHFTTSHVSSSSRYPPDLTSSDHHVTSSESVVVHGPLPPCLLQAACPLE
jgi:hypothetical protein